MVQLLGLVLISFVLTSILLVPFINWLFEIKRRGAAKSIKVESTTTSDTPISNQLLKGKDVSVPVGGGILLVIILAALSTIVTLLIKGELGPENGLLLITLLSFGFIGFLDDVRKIFISFSGKYAGIRSRYILILQTLFAFIIATLIYQQLGFNNLFIPGIGNVILGVFYIPLAAFAIVSFANAYNFSDGMDGLSTGLLTICLIAFLALASAVFNDNLSIFVGIWIGSLIAYLYFNVFPARIYLGDAGAFGFGATLAVVGLLTGKIFGLGVIGGVYVVIALSSLIQILSKRFLHRKVFPVAPLHMYFKYIGWEEPKIVARFWLAGAIFAILGLFLSLL